MVGNWHKLALCFLSNCVLSVKLMQKGESEEGRPKGMRVEAVQDLFKFVLLGHLQSTKRGYVTMSEHFLDLSLSTAGRNGYHLLHV